LNAGLQSDVASIAIAVGSDDKPWENKEWAYSWVLDLTRELVPLQTDEDYGVDVNHIWLLSLKQMCLLRVFELGSCRLIEKKTSIA
jgi:hypothetical protein